MIISLLREIHLSSPSELLKFHEFSDFLFMFELSLPQSLWNNLNDPFAGDTQGVLNKTVLTNCGCHIPLPSWSIDI